MWLHVIVQLLDWKDVTSDWVELDSNADHALKLLLRYLLGMLIM